MPRFYNHIRSNLIHSASVSLSELHQLQNFAQVQEQRKLETGSFRKEVLRPQPIERVGNYANPISPLRDRDITALAQLFHRSDMSNIEADLNQMLLRLLPEPCWDEDELVFLQEFL